MPGDASRQVLALVASILFHGVIFLAIRLVMSGEESFGILSREKPVITIETPALLIDFAPPTVAEASPDVPPPIPPVASAPNPAPAPVPPPLPRVEPIPPPEPILSPSPEVQPAPASEPAVSVFAPIVPQPAATPEPIAATALEPGPVTTETLLASGGAVRTPRPTNEPGADTVLAAAANPVPRTAPQIPGPGLYPEANPRDTASLLLEPRYRHAPTPAYPGAARRLGLEGRVLLEVQVSATGSVGGAIVRESSGHRILDQTALSAVKRWRFHPAYRDKLPVASSAIIPVEFKLE